MALTAGKRRALNRILTAICEVYGWGVCIHEPLMERNRYKTYVEPRQVGHYLSVTHLEGVTSTEIGEFWGRDHSTILCSRTRVEHQLEYDRDLKKRIDAVVEKVKELKAAEDRTGIPHYYTAHHNAHGLAEWRSEEDD